MGACVPLFGDRLNIRVISYQVPPSQGLKCSYLCIKFAIQVLQVNQLDVVYLSSLA
jgi:hypothetical protein